jgi:hypothetical protein
MSTVCKYSARLSRPSCLEMSLRFLFCMLQGVVLTFYLGCHSFLHFLFFQQSVTSTTKQLVPNEVKFNGKLTSEYSNLEKNGLDSN